MLFSDAIQKECQFNTHFFCLAGLPIQKFKLFSSILFSSKLGTMFELSNLLAIGLWILVGIGLGTFVGFFFGRTLTLKKESRKLAQERDSIFRSLTQLIQSTEQMTTSVDRNNQSLATVEQNVKDITLPADFADLQGRLLSSIDKVLKTNHEMENDLAVSRYRLEDQAQQLDHSRKEARTDVLCDVGNRKAFKESFGSCLLYTSPSPRDS